VYPNNFFATEVGLISSGVVLDNLFRRAAIAAPQFAGQPNGSQNLQSVGHL
jgi:hypothetical protein